MPVGSEANIKLEPIRSRTPARIVVAAAVVLLVGVGIWGAAGAARSVRAYRHADRVESAIEQARYALALEDGSYSDQSGIRGRQKFVAAASGFSVSVRRLARAGRDRDEHLAASLRQAQRRLAADADAGFSARLAGEAVAADAIFERTVRPETTRLDQRLARAFQAEHATGADAWPTRTRQKLELGAVALLVALGLASAAVYLLRLAGYRRRLVKARRAKVASLEQAALSDSLTGLGNHRAFYDDLRRELTTRARQGSCFSVVMLDLDGLKQINDSLGHQAGDDRLRAVANGLRTTLRAGDRAYRTGGDEFMALLPGERAYGGLVFAQRLQTAIAESGDAVAVSCGVVESIGLEGARSLVHRADLALYEAKRTGRQVVVYSDGISPKPHEKPEDLALRRHHRLLATALAQAVDAKDVGTRNHCETVSALCVLIGQALGLGGERIEQLRLAGLLHDVGKIGIADALLQKPLALDDDERSAMSGHVQIGHTIVSAAGLEDEAKWILHHHEHVDGSGYPDGLHGPLIPLESRIILVADAFEAMTTDRPYRVSRGPAAALAELRRKSGTQFDPSCVEALSAVLEADHELRPRALTSATGAGRAVRQTTVQNTDPQVATA